MNRITAIMIEDERASRETLRNYLKKYCPEVDLVAEAPGIREGRELIMEHRPDLLFLDVEMPFGNGFDLIEMLPDLKLEIIFITAFSDYAVRALNLSASYYLLKPIDIDELVAAVVKARENIQNQNRNERLAVLLNNLNSGSRNELKITLPTLEGFDVVNTREIIHARANDNMTDVFLSGNKRKLVCRPLKFFEEALAEHGFLRVHKSHLINLDHVQGYRRGQGGVVTMSDGAEVDVSVRRKAEFLRRMA